jgi:hypothetical protein
MNERIKERIKELRKQAGIKETPVTLSILRDSNGELTSKHNYPLDNFAELIVKECVSVINAEIVNSHGALGDGLATAVELIKNHFGIDDEHDKF